MELIGRSATDSSRTEEVIKSCVGLLGDLGQTFGVKVAHVYAMPFVPALLQEAESIDDDSTSSIAKMTSHVSPCLLLLA